MKTAPRALAFLALLILVACGTSAGRNIELAAGLAEVTLADLPAVETITTPDDADTHFFSVAKIVKRAADAGADPAAVESFKVQARMVTAAIHRWRTAGDRSSWAHVAPLMMDAARAVPGVK